MLGWEVPISAMAAAPSWLQWEVHGVTIVNHGLLTLYDWLVPVGLLVGHLGIAARVMSGVTGLERIARLLAGAFFVLLAWAWIWRFVAVGRVPFVGAYETALSLAVATVIVAVGWEAASRGRLVLGPLSALIAGTLLSHGRRFDSTPIPGPEFSAPWLAGLHGLLAWFAFGFLAINNLLALRLVVSRGGEVQGTETAFRRSLVIGFVLLAAAVLSGAVCTWESYRVAFVGDPVEVLGVAAACLYGGLLWYQKTSRGTLRTLAALCLAAFFALAVAYRAVDHLPPGESFHQFGVGASDSR